MNEVQERRHNNLRDFIDRYDLSTGSDSTAGEDLAEYMQDDYELPKWAVITRSSDSYIVYITPMVTLEAAQSFAMTNISDDIYSEFPEWIVNFDDVDYRYKANITVRWKRD